MSARRVASAGQLDLSPGHLQQHGHARNKHLHEGPHQRLENKAPPRNYHRCQVVVGLLVSRRDAIRDVLLAGVTVTPV
jgi:hypothetical protein